ncbi:alpha/beta hydrolase [Paenibacillus sp. alder61]|uniref:Alpha/beta hydrolase n=1 Tax=Paenibacillus faecis TaxID=862114 RepID=A0A5D0CSB1_9BACL|nr:MULTISPECIES: alpha/beta hydrolase [Paenibacillus]MCA1296471.1 alpha/beta hydrolase [Paenibacillus sp. alder61]TYA11687.1 alpha/beta hydrolase [Paenibacillus faecis]
MNHVISKDGIQIAYDKQGKGPALILVASAAADHRDAGQLAERLGEHFTVYNYDRRGRGASTDAASYTVEREVEDIQALIAESGGSALLFGSSSGAVLALEAASRLKEGIDGVCLYEPPFIVDDGRSPVPSDYVQHLNRLVDAGDRSGAVEYFLTQALGVPSEFVEYMKADPSWKAMEQLAHTLAYDGMVMGDTQSGQPLPKGRWSVDVPVHVLCGEKSPSFLHSSAKALVELLANAEYRVMAGQDHSAVVMAPAALAEEIAVCFKA